MTGKELYTLFMDNEITPEKVATMDFDDLVQRIVEKRLHAPDDIGLSDVEIALRIHDYAQSKAEKQ